MEGLKSLLTCGMLFCTSVAAFAQFSNVGCGNGASSRRGGCIVKRTDSYSRIYMGYNPMTRSFDIDDVDDITWYGMNVGYLRGINLVQSQPLFLEVGGQIAYNFKKEYDDSRWNDGRHKYKALSVSVPVNFTYKFTFGDGDIAISPFLGLTFKGNIIAKDVHKWKETHYDYYNGYRYAKEEWKKEKTDYFDREDMTDKRNRWKRFQAGWQVGANLDIRHFSIGVHYGADFNELCYVTTTKNWGVSVGCNF